MDRKRQARRRSDDTDGDLFAGLYSQVHRIACVVAPMDVEPDDLVQDAFVRYLRRNDSVDVDNDAAYLTTILVRLASDRRRSWLRRNRAHAAHGPSPAASTPSYPSDLAVLDMVSARERAVLFLHDVEGLTFEHVAATLGGSAQALRKTAERARRRLQLALEEDEDAAR